MMKMRVSAIYSVIIALLLTFAAGIGTVDAEENYRTDDEPSVLETEKTDTDTISSKKRVREKIHRRAFTNYRYVKKGDIAVGFDVSYGDFDSDDSQFFSLLEDFSAGGTSFSINPRIGYFYKDNNAVGLKYGYRKVNADVDTLTIDVDEDLDLSFHKTNLEYINSSVALIHRSYVGLDKGHRFALFNEMDLAYSWGKMRYDRMLEEGRKNTRTETQEVRLGINPGISVFVIDKFTLEASIGVAGLKWHKERQITNGIKDGWSRTVGMDYKFNILNIKIGIVAYL